MKPTVYPRLSLMMFLQYAVWGAWLPVAGRFMQASKTTGGLGFTGDQMGLIIGLGGSIGAVTAPFIAGQIADRYFNTERFLALLLAIGGVIMWALSQQTQFGSWLALAMAYSVVFMPTLALSNSLTFAHLTDRNRQFPFVRVWGTIGWIAASWVFPWIYLQTGLKFTWLPPFLVGTEHADATARLADAFRFSAIMTWGYAVYCLLLPQTPPKRDAVERLAFAKAFRLLTHPSFLVLVVISLMISSIHQIYFIQTGPYFSSIGLKDSHIGPAMTVGQFAEIAVLPLLGYLLKALGFRAVITIGCLAYLARFSFFGTTDLPPGVIIGSLVLHGVCYSCFFAASFIYVDRLAPEDIRHSAQTLYGILILGLGPVFGGMLSGRLQSLYTITGPAGTAIDFSRLWYTVAAIGGAAAVLFALAFRDETKARACAKCGHESAHGADVCAGCGAPLAQVA